MTSHYRHLSLTDLAMEMQEVPKEYRHQITPVGLLDFQMRHQWTQQPLMGKLRCYVKALWENYRKGRCLMGDCGCGQGKVARRLSMEVVERDKRIRDLELKLEAVSLSLAARRARVEYLEAENASLRRVRDAAMAVWQSINAATVAGGPDVRTNDSEVIELYRAMCTEGKDGER
uniref:Uncharacterized protein n=1 Tax=viral metagenome TaxID=1070528 RepID=A0A6M3LRA7_9ZZZZ